MNKQELQNDESNYVDTETEDYLLEDYALFEDKKYLRSCLQIEEYFKDNGADFLDCGQGYATHDAEILCKIGDKFYIVGFEADIESSKQDRGDRLYFVDRITKVTYKETHKPLPKNKATYRYTFDLSEARKNELEDLLEGNDFNFKVD